MTKSIYDQIKAIQKKSMEKAEKIHKYAYFEVMNRAIVGTPVSDGLLVGSWFPGFESNVPTPTAPHDSTARLKTAIEAPLIGKTFYMINPQPYAYKIEYLGHSTEKAPQGMVRLAAADWQNIAQTAINKYK